jgi:hypothetical protein
VIATPLPQDNLSNRAYDFVAYEGSEIRNLEEKQQAYLVDLTNNDIPAEEKTPYDFHPQLFGVINLDVKASDVLMGRFSWSALFILVCAIAASVIQYFATKQQMPSGKSEKKKGFRDVMKAAKEGRQIEDSEISEITTGRQRPKPSRRRKSPRKRNPEPASPQRKKLRQNKRTNTRFHKRLASGDPPDVTINLQSVLLL